MASDRVRRGAFAIGVLAGCSSGAPQPLTKPPYTATSVKSGLVTPADLGKGAIEVEDSDHASHVVYTPPTSIPTCPYVQRSEDVKVVVQRRSSRWAGIRSDGSSSARSAWGRRRFRSSHRARWFSRAPRSPRTR
ncbi:hypothetical protein ACFQX6_58375 [Streptosporangium lutulentum]